MCDVVDDDGGGAPGGREDGPAALDVDGPATGWCAGGSAGKAGEGRDDDEDGWVGLVVLAAWSGEVMMVLEGDACAPKEEAPEAIFWVELSILSYAIDGPDSEAPAKKACVFSA